MWPQRELLPAVHQVHLAISRTSWGGRAGRTRRRILDFILSLAQERGALVVEETHLRIAEALHLAASTVGIRIRELEAEGWLDRLSTGRWRHEGSVWRVQVPPRLRAGRCRAGAPAHVNRVIKKASPDLPLCLEILGHALEKPRLTARSETQATPNPNPATKGEPVPGRSADPGGGGEGKARPGRAKRSKPRRAQGSHGPAATPRAALPVWGEAEYLALRNAVIRATGAAAASPRVHGQVKAVTRMLLAGGFRPADVAAVVVKIGHCSPIRLRAVLRGGHVDLPLRSAPELVPGPARTIVEQLVAALAFDADARLRPAERDPELEEREEQLRWEAEANRLQRALFAEVRASSVR